MRNWVALKGSQLQVLAFLRVWVCDRAVTINTLQVTLTGPKVKIKNRTYFPL